ncbi:MAG: efflux RND transporter periplasmic adaptor subunit [Thermoguttaceae bacterium]|nr:efflux RND transporter periplasmic adaptor subunit [Thermoguttaceae bacterium]
MKHIRLLHLFCLSIAISSMPLAGCGVHQEKKPLPTEPAIPLVRVQQVGQGVVRETRTFPVFAREGQTAKLSFRVPGQLEQFDVKIGQKFKKDEVIAQLDQRDYKLAIARIEKGLAEANAGLSAMKTGARAEDVAALEAQVSAASSQAEQAERQFKRMENLRQDGTVSEVQYDASKAARDMALGAKSALSKQLEKARRGSRQEEIDMMNAKIAGLNIDLQLARNKLGDTTLKAPFDGTVSEKYFDNHEVVLPGAAIISLTDAREIEATLSIPQEIVLRKGDIEQIQCEFETFSGRLVARIKEIGQSVQSGNLSWPMTIGITLPTEKGEQKILPGMTGTAYLEMKSSNETFSLPNAALIPGTAGTSTDESAVWLVNAETGTVTRQVIKTGALSKDGVVVELGLKPGDKVVVAGARFLKDGQQVRLEGAQSDEKQEKNASTTQK